MFKKLFGIIVSVIIALSVCTGVVFSDINAVYAAESITKHAPDTEALITIVEHNADLKRMLVQSIKQAKQINSDRETNPAQTLEEYYDFIDWATTAMPFNILPSAARHPKLYESIDQSLDYFYFVIDQPLDELKGKGHYYNSLQYVEPFRSWMIVFTKHWGEYLSTKASWNEEFYKKTLADERFGMNNGWYESPEKWSTFNDFFARRLSSPDARPIAEKANEAVVVSPADSAPQGIWKIDKNSRFEQAKGVRLKSANFNSVNDILGKGSAFAGQFANGVLTHTFLDVNDYHRYHFPVSGTVKEVRTILSDDAAGGITVWNEKLRKYELQDQIPGWQSIETRACVIVDTGKYGLVAILPIGMSQVSSVNFEETVKVGAVVKKGDPLGYFLFGGSDIVMLFQQQAGFELTVPAIDANSYKHIYMGEAYGIMRGAKK